MLHILGIDPGKTGAFVLMDQQGGVIEKLVMPLIGKELDHLGIASIVSICSGSSHIYIEDVHAVHGSAAGATFNFGYVCGAIRQCVTDYRIPFTMVQPKKWQSIIYQGVKEIRKPSYKITKGKFEGQTRKGNRDTKKMSLLAAQQLFPTVDLRKNSRCKIAHDGIVDALLIAEYGRRQNLTTEDFIKDLENE